MHFVKASIMNAWIYSIVSVLAVSLVSLVGIVTLLLRRTLLRRILFVLVSFAVGGLFGGAFFHLIPESVEHMGIQRSSVYVMMGIVAFFVLEKFIHWRHCHAEDDRTHPFVAMNLIGDSVHNFMDGLLIGASYLADIGLGIATTTAIIFHEIPQELGDFGVFVHGGCSARRALAYNFLSALTAVFGAVIALIVGAEVHGFSAVLVPVAAGGFIYIAGSDLIPELKHNVSVRHSVLQLAAILAGLVIMFMFSVAGHDH